jgi:hypothetical protein
MIRGSSPGRAGNFPRHWDKEWMIGGSSPSRGWEFFSSLGYGLDDLGFESREGLGIILFTGLRTE